MENMKNELTFNPLTAKQLSQAFTSAEKGIAKAFDARNVKTFADVRELANRVDKLNGNMLLALCRIFYDCKRKSLWTQDPETNILNFKSFESWAQYNIKNVEKATAENYVFIGRFVNEQGTCDTLPRFDMDEIEKPYEYTALLTLVRACGKGLQGKREEKEAERYKRICALCEKGYVSPTMESKKDIEKAVEKGLRELYHIEVKDKTKANTESNTNNTDSNTENKTDNKTESNTESKTNNNTERKVLQPVDIARIAVFELIKQLNALQAPQETTEKAKEIASYIDSLTESERQ